MSSPVRPDINSRPTLAWLFTVLAVALGLGAIAGVGIPGLIVAGAVAVAGGAIFVAYHNHHRWVRIVSGSIAVIMMVFAIYATAVPFAPAASTFSITTETDPNKFSESFNPTLQPQGEFYFPGRTSLEGLPPPPPAGLQQAKHQWAVDNGGIDYKGGVVQFVVAAQGSSVLILGMKAIVDHQLKLADGLLVSCRCGDQLPVRHLSISVDTGEVEFRDELGNPQPMAFTIAPGTAELFSAAFGAGNCNCAWYIELSVLIDGVQQTARVDNEGEPFQIASTGALEPSFEYLGGSWHAN